MTRRLIGVDVGGTKISIAALEDGRLSEPQITPTDVSSTEALLAQLSALISTAVGGHDGTTVGLGIPCVIEFATGRARYAANLPVVDVPLRDVLTQRTGTPVLVDNDATVAALAEACDPAGEVIHQDLAMLTVGTGIGGGVILGGRIFRGSTGAAPELGHLLIGLDLADGAPAARRRLPAGRLARARVGGPRARRAGPRARLRERAPRSWQAAQGGDETAIAAVRILGERLGIGIANVLHAYEPAVVCIGGARAGRATCCSAPPSAWPGRGRCPAWATARRSGSRATAPRPGCGAPRCWPRWRAGPHEAAPTHASRHRTRRGRLRLPWPTRSK
jgi:glucokinase